MDNCLLPLWGPFNASTHSRRNLVEETPQGAALSAVDLPHRALPSQIAIVFSQPCGLCRGELASTGSPCAEETTLDSHLSLTQERHFVPSLSPSLVDIGTPPSLDRRPISLSPPSDNWYTPGVKELAQKMGYPQRQVILGSDATAMKSEPQVPSSPKQTSPSMALSIRRLSIDTTSSALERRWKVNPSGETLPDRDERVLSSASASSSTAPSTPVQIQCTRPLVHPQQSQQKGQHRHSNRPMRKESSRSMGTPRSLDNIKVGAGPPRQQSSEPVAGDILVFTTTGSRPESQKTREPRPAEARQSRALRPAKSCNIERETSKGTPRGSKGSYFSLSKPAAADVCRYPKSTSETCRSCTCADEASSQDWKTANEDTPTLTLQAGCGKVLLHSAFSGPLPLICHEQQTYVLLSPSRVEAPQLVTLGTDQSESTSMPRTFSHSAPLHAALAAQFLPRSESPPLTRHSGPMTRSLGSQYLPGSNSPPFPSSPSPRGRALPRVDRLSSGASARRHQLVDGKALLAHVSPRGPLPHAGFAAPEGQGNTGAFTLPPPPLGDSVTVVEAPFLFRKLKRTPKLKTQNGLLNKVHGKV